VDPEEIEDFDNARGRVRVDNRVGEPHLISNPVPEEVVDPLPEVFLRPELLSDINQRPCDLVESTGAQPLGLRVVQVPPNEFPILGFPTRVSSRSKYEASFFP
jgi:hypothetical protein